MPSSSAILTKTEALVELSKIARGKDQRVAVTALRELLDYYAKVPPSPAGSINGMADRLDLPLTLDERLELGRVLDAAIAQAKAAGR